MAKNAPQMTAAFRKHGVTTRDMMLTMFAMFQAGMIASVEKSGQKVPKLPEDMNPENLTFYKQHEAEIQALAAKMKSVQKADEKEEAEEQEEKEN